jgi:aspartate/methionine/tyrosine aminotransferase
MMIINSPSNPSRNVIPVEDLAHTALAAQHCDAWLLSDEISSRIVYDELDAAAIYSTPGLVEGTIIMDDFLKPTPERVGVRVMVLSPRR